MFFSEFYFENVNLITILRLCENKFVNSTSIYAKINHKKKLLNFNLINFKIYSSKSFLFLCLHILICDVFI